jgi:hypothetical protein
VESPIGYHILRVDHRREAGILSLEEVSEQIRTSLLEGRRKEKVTSEVARLKEKAEAAGQIELMPLEPFLAALDEEPEEPSP